MHTLFFISESNATTTAKKDARVFSSRRV